MGRTPDFVIVGAMRSGTSSLAGYLDTHPDVFVTPRKEIHYFNQFYDEGFDWYLEKFAEAGEQAAVGEATPIYMCEQETMDRLADALPEARIIAILREPVARAYSHYWFNRARGNEPLSFEDALAAEPERLKGGDSRSRSRASYFSRGVYAAQVERILDLFPADRVHVLLFEDLTKRPQETYSEVCRFLGVDPQHEPPNLGRQINVYKQPRWPELNKVIRRYPKPIRTFIYRANRKKSAPYPPMSESTAAQLAEQYEAPNRLLGKLLGRDLSEWLR